MSTFASLPAVRSARGVTLVELVTMLLVVAVLAAVALPRYADAQGKAREARVKAAATSMQAVAALVHGSARNRGLQCDESAPAQLDIDGTPIVLSHCYPQAAADFGGGILAAARLQSDGWVATLRRHDGATTLRLEAADALTPDQCAVSYTPPARGGDTVRIATQLAGC